MDHIVFLQLLSLYYQKQLVLLDLHYRLMFCNNRHKFETQEGRAVQDHPEILEDLEHLESLYHLLLQ